MNFTREPLIETIITPREGYQLQLRSSKGQAQEEFIVEAVEVISFGKATFFRSLEKPKCFLVPVSDYELIEVREARQVLKTSATERGYKIGGGRETLLKTAKDEISEPEPTATASAEPRTDKRRERRRSRKKHTKGEGDQVEREEENAEAPSTPEVKTKKAEKPTLIPPPTTLISESITRYKALQAAAETENEDKVKSVLIPPPPFPVRLETEDLGSDEEQPELPF